MIVLQAIQKVAVLAGVIFGLIELRQLKRQRDIQASAAMLQSLQTPDIGSTMMILVSLPNGLSAGKLKQRLGDDFGAVINLASMFESLGPLVARGHLPIEIYADYYRGATVVCWGKLRRYVEIQRKEDWGNLFEWFQWLAERMAERAPLHEDIPVFERLQNWQSASDYKETFQSERR